MGVNVLGGRHLLITSQKKLLCGVKHTFVGFLCIKQSFSHNPTLY